MRFLSFFLSPCTFKKSNKMTTDTTKNVDSDSMPVTTEQEKHDISEATVEPAGPGMIAPTEKAEKAVGTDTSQRGDPGFETNTEPSKSVESLLEKILRDMEVQQDTNTQRFDSSCKISKGLYDAVLKVPGQIEGPVREKVQNLEQELSAVKEHLSTLQGQNEQVVGQLREIADIIKRNSCELVNAFKAKLVKSAWECFLVAQGNIERKSAESEEMQTDAERFERLRLACDDFVREFAQTLEIDYDTVRFEDANGEEIVNSRHQVLRWQEAEHEGQHKTIAESLRCGVTDLAGNVICRQFVYAYDYNKKPAE